MSAAVFCVCVILVPGLRLSSRRQLNSVFLTESQSWNGESFTPVGRTIHFRRAPRASLEGGVSAGSIRSSGFRSCGLRCREFGFVDVAVPYTMDAAFQGGFTEVDQQADG